MRRRWMLAPGIVMVAALGGCSLLVKAPTVRVTDVQASSLGLSGGTLRLRLELENPNGYDLTAEGFTYRFDIADGSSHSEGGGGEGAHGADGRHEGEGGQEHEESVEWRNLLDGSYEDVVNLPADGTALLTVEVPFEYGDVGSLVGRLLRRGEVEYRFSGLYRFKVLVGGVNVPFDQQGTFRP